MGTSLYFKAGPVIYYMDSYSDSSAPLTASLSESPMQDGTSRSDNYKVNNRVVTLSGKVTDVKLASSSDLKKAGDWVDGVYDIMNSRTPVSLKHRADREPTNNWYIESFTPSQNRGSGIGYIGSNGDVVQSFDITITFKQPILVQGLVQRIAPVSAYLDVTSGKSSKSSSVKKFNDKEDAPLTDDQKKAEAQKNAFRNKIIFLTGKPPVEQETP